MRDFKDIKIAVAGTGYAHHHGEQAHTHYVRSRL